MSLNGAARRRAFALFLTVTLILASPVLAAADNLVHWSLSASSANNFVDSLVGSFDYDVTTASIVNYLVVVHSSLGTYGLYGFDPIISAAIVALPGQIEFSNSGNTPEPDALIIQSGALDTLSPLSATVYPIGADFSLAGDDEAFTGQLVYTPEPCCMLLVGFGLLGFAVLRQKLKITVR